MNQAIKKLNYLNRLVDLLAIYAAWILAYYLRFELEIGGEAKGLTNIERYTGYGLLLFLVAAIVFKNLKIYEGSVFNSLVEDLANVIKANTVSFIIFLTVSFFVSQERLSRMMLVYHFVFSSFFVIISKSYFRGLLLRRSMKVALVGDGSSILKYVEVIKDLANYKITHWFEAPAEYEMSLSRSEFSPEELETNECDGVVIGFNTIDANKAQSYIEKLSKLLIPILVLPDVEFAKLGHRLQNFKGIPVLSINEPNVKFSSLVLKRVFDFSACSLGLMLISPLLLAIGAIVKLTSKGPIFYGQVRMGVDGKEFKMWKFRSMVTGEVNQEGWTVENDPRVTVFGKFLRKTSLDELPQLWNVILGDMSLVGPRPERPVFVEQFRHEIPEYMLRHKFKAGITGWAQVNGWRGDTSIQKRIECDIWYIKNWSFWLDLSIIFLTFWKGFVNKNAY